MTFAPGYIEPVIPMVSTAGPWSFTYGISTSSPASATWESANRAVYQPVYVPTTCVAKRMWWINGSSVSATYNIDAGIYADAGGQPGAKLVSTGSTAQGTATQVQFADITDTTIPPGLYWFALAVDTTSATLFRQSAAVNQAGNALLMFDQNTAFALPSTATPVERQLINVWAFGFSTTTIT